MFFLVDTFNSKWYDVVINPETEETMFFDTKKEATEYGQQELQSFIVVRAIV